MRRDRASRMGSVSSSDLAMARSYTDRPYILLMPATYDHTHIVRHQLSFCDFLFLSLQLLYNICLSLPVCLALILS